MIKMKFKTIDRFLLFSFSISIMMNSYIMFFWETYEPHGLGVFFRIYSIVSILFLALKEILIRKKYNSMIIISFLFLSIIESYIFFSNVSLFLEPSTIIFRLVRLLVSVGVLFSLNDDEIEMVFHYFSRLFVIVCIPSVIYFLLGNIAKSIPHTIMYSSQGIKDLKGVYYDHYPLGLLMHTSSRLIRISGIFDEPGFMGTMLAFIFATTRKKNSRIWNIIILLAGIFTFSMAFIILIFVYYLADALSQNNLNSQMRFIIVIALALVSLLIILSIQTSNPYINFVQDRFFTDGGIISNNRYTTGFNGAFEQFIDQGGHNLWFGNGSGSVSMNASLRGSSNYRCLIFEYGIIGTSLYFLFLGFLIFCLKPKKTAFSFIVIFMLSIYQRPYVLDFLNISVLYCGIKHLNLNS